MFYWNARLYLSKSSAKIIYCNYTLDYNCTRALFSASGLVKKTTKSDDWTMELKRAKEGSTKKLVSQKQLYIFLGKEWILLKTTYRNFVWEERKKSVLKILRGLLGASPSLVETSPLSWLQIHYFIQPMEVEFIKI